MTLAGGIDRPSTAPRPGLWSDRWAEFVARHEGATSDRWLFSLVWLVLGRVWVSCGRALGVFGVRVLGVSSGRLWVVLVVLVVLSGRVMLASGGALRLYVGEVVVAALALGSRELVLQQEA